MDNTGPQLYGIMVSLSLAGSLSPIYCESRVASEWLTGDALPHCALSSVGHSLVAAGALHFQPVPVPAIMLGQRHEGLAVGFVWVEAATIRWHWYSA